MRGDSTVLEASRMQGLTVENYPWLHERHRVFPQIFENRNHRKIFDTSAGIGIIAKKLCENLSLEVTCNEVDQTCVNQLKKLDIKLLSFDLDVENEYPLKNETYDAIISLATLEHLINIDHYILELKRILKDSGRLYISVPNYASLYWMIPLIKGRTFHDPFGERSRYEFYAHIRYFTYKTLLDYISHFGFSIDTVYCPLPTGSTKFQEIKNKSWILSATIRLFFYLLYCLSPRWHQEPILCFAKNKMMKNNRFRKVIL